MILGLLASEIVQLPATNASILHSVNASNASNATNATAATHAADAATALSAGFPSYSSQPSAFNTTIWASTIMPTTVFTTLAVYATTASCSRTRQRVLGYVPDLFPL